MDKVVADLDYTDEEKAAETLKEYDALKTELDEVMEAWEENTEALDEI